MKQLIEISLTLWWWLLSPRHARAGYRNCPPKFKFVETYWQINR
jgi:hypothetical protein